MLFVVPQGLIPMQVVPDATLAPGVQEEEEEEEEDAEALLARVPEDTAPLRICLATAQGCLLLLVLKQHLKATYGLTDG